VEYPVDLLLVLQLVREVTQSGHQRLVVPGPSLHTLRLREKAQSLGGVLARAGGAGGWSRVLDEVHGLLCVAERFGVLSCPAEHSSALIETYSSKCQGNEEGGDGQDCERGTLLR
jgi:hypothetical protein